MFSQSELDNYKLQMELLQEKLKRSEICRQQLEQKLDKILKKRDEHDKMIRSKARQKYQEFLEEQQRRNERNKQLVQMLERIEQQTEAMNARSERLKMLKLQYEMYFAKLVHSQTKRCLQNSIYPVLPTMPISSAQPFQPAVMQQPVVEESNFVSNNEATTMMIHQPYPMRPATSQFKTNSLLESHAGNIPRETPEISKLANFDGTEKVQCKDIRKPMDSSEMQNPQLCQYQTKYEYSNTNFALPPENAEYSREKLNDHISYGHAGNANKSLSSVNNLLLNDKENAYNLSTMPSAKLNKTINLDMMPSEIMHLNGTAAKTKTYNHVTNNNYSPDNKTNPLQLNSAKDINNEISAQSTNQKDSNLSNNFQNYKQNYDIIDSLEPEVRKEAKTEIVNKENELEKTHDATATKTHQDTENVLDSQPIKAVAEIPPNSSNNESNSNKQPEITEQNEEQAVLYDVGKNSSIAPISIENIENKIYGELITPSQTVEVAEKPENSQPAPNLLENLVAQAANIEITNNGASEEHEPQQNVNPVNDTITPNNKSDQHSIKTNNEQPVVYDGDNNNQKAEEPTNSFAEYTNYENIDHTAIDEVPQDQQQYDYSNYDSTQYSYPGYIYDETTGEYKPDPNASAEQYATDQPYASEVYDQQYQQPTYTENQDGLSTTVDDTTTVYNNYDTPQQEISSALSPSDINTEEEQIPSNLELITPQSDLTHEELSIIPNSTILKPTSILSSADKNDSQKKKKRVNFIDSSETEESAADNKSNIATVSSESDFAFSSSAESEAKAT